MINFDDVVKENIKKDCPENSNCPEIPDHPYKISIIWGPWYGTTNSLFNLLNQQPDIEKIYLYAKDQYEVKYQCLINKRKNAGLKFVNDSKAFVEYSDCMDDIYKNIEEHNPNKKRKTLIVFNEMIAGTLNVIVTDFFLSEVERSTFICYYHAILSCCS